MNGQNWIEGGHSTPKRSAACKKKVKYIYIYICNGPFTKYQQDIPVVVWSSNPWAFIFSTSGDGGQRPHVTRILVEWEGKGSNWDQLRLFNQWLFLLFLVPLVGGR